MYGNLQAFCMDTGAGYSFYNADFYSDCINNYLYSLNENYKDIKKYKK